MRRLEQSERAAAEETAAATNGTQAATSSASSTVHGVDLDQFTKIEASLLRYFQAHQLETVSTEQLLAEVWKRPDATNRRVQEAIRRLRLHLEAANPPIGAIENVAVKLLLAAHRANQRTRLNRLCGEERLVCIR